MADPTHIDYLHDTDGRGIWVTRDSGAVRLDLGSLYGINGYRLFLTRKTSRELREALAEAEAGDDA